MFLPSDYFFIPEALKILGFICFIFPLSRSSNLFQLLHHGDSFKSVQGFTLCFQLLFPFVWSFFCLPEFFMKVLHDGSSMIYFLLEVFIQILFRGAHAFFILQSGVQFFLPYHWRGYYVILDNLSSCFMIHRLLTMGYIKSINLFVGVILGYISPKVFPKDYCYYGAHNWPKFFFYPPG